MTICDKCGQEVLVGNDATIIEAIAHDQPFVLLCQSCHFLPTATCEGSPSRAQYIEGQPHDSRDDCDGYHPDQESLYRNAYKEAQRQEKNNTQFAIALLAMHLNFVGGESGRDQGAMMPQSDVNDFQNSAHWIPGEVTSARRRGEKVTFVHQGEQSDWYWLMPNGTRINHG